MKTNESPRLTLLRGGGGVEESGSAFTTYGPVKVGLTTSHRTQHHQLSELLNDLERQIQDLESRFSEVCVISLEDILHRAERLLSTIKTDTTDVIE